MTTIQTTLDNNRNYSIYVEGLDSNIYDKMKGNIRGNISNSDAKYFSNRGMMFQNAEINARKDRLRARLETKKNK